MDYKNIVGQEQIKEFIRKTINMNIVSHAYIICGEKGSGRLDIAKLFAASLQCKSEYDLYDESTYNRPCGDCPSCKQMDGGNQPDVITVTTDKQSIGVDVIRQQVNNTAQIKPYAGPYKIYIIPEAEKMTEESQNALLKTIEEPPEYVIIFLITDNIGSLLPTVISRCIELNMKPLSQKVIVEYLMDNMNIPDYQAEASAFFAQGNIGKAIRFATDSSFITVRNDVIKVLKTIEDKGTDEIAAIVKNIKEEKYDIDDYLDMAILWYRDVLLYKALKDTSTLIFKEETKSVIKDAKVRSYENIELCIEAIERAKRRLNANVNFDITIELMLTTLKENI
ncbi:MAG: DNA polymerase III subunit delta [Lachnospiraceae bacterium]|nr:DNA polymerase III subunit delta [Lachnospiraceae bacterium]